MSNVLITGMTASHTSEATNQRTMSFAGVVSRALVSDGHTVTIGAPDMRWTFDDIARYDSVIVGVAPITSVTASNAYGGLHVIDLLWSDPRLTLMVDAPRPLQISASLRSVVGTPDNLVKPFYAKRRGYVDASDPGEKARLLETARRLLENEWPTTIYPSLPWHDASTVRSQFPQGATSLHGINLDALLISGNPPSTQETRAAQWVADDPKSAWVQKLAPTISNQVVGMKEDPRQGDEDVSKRIGQSLGSLITSHREGTWWTYRIVQSLNNGTPVATDWREASTIGSSWGVLPSAIESLRHSDTENLAWTQLEEYAKSIPSREEAVDSLKTIIGTNTSKRKVRK